MHGNKSKMYKNLDDSQTAVPKVRAPVREDAILMTGGGKGEGGDAVRILEERGLEWFTAALLGFCRLGGRPDTVSTLVQLCFHGHAQH